MATSGRTVWPGIVMVIGLVGGIPTCGYGALRWVGSGMGAMGCQSSGCEARLASESSTGIAFMLLGGLGALGLFVLGVVGSRAVRAGQLAQASSVAPSLPAARVVSRSSDPASPPAEP